MKTSESIDKIAPALLRAQKKIGAAIKGSANPFFKSRYADLGAVMEACKEQLNSEGIAVVQPIHSDETGDYVETILVHESGQILTSRMRLLPSKNMQELGSATSYARRYSLQSMVFVPQEDDDGNHSTFGKGSPDKAPAKSALPPVTKEAIDTVVANPSPQTKAAIQELTKPEAPKRSSFKKPAPAPAAAPAVTTTTTTASDDGWE